MGNKNKFFAFFQTEEQFLRYTLKYINEHPEFLAAHDNEVRHFARCFQADISTMALGRMGFREKRFQQYDEKMVEVAKEYIELGEDDFKADAEMVYSKECFERELKQYTGKMYRPIEERY